MNLTTQTLKLYWQAAWKYRKYVIGLLISIPIGNLALRHLPPLIVAAIIDKLSNNDYIKGDVWSSFGSDILIYTLLTFGGGVIAWRFIIFMIWKLESNVQRDLYQKMFSKYISLGADFHANSFGGSLVSQTSKMVGAYVRLQDTFAFQIYTLFISYTFISIVMYNRAPEFIWAMWIFSIAFIAFAITLSKPVRKLTAIEADRQNKVTGNLADSITNVMAIKSFAGSTSERKSFNKNTEKLYNSMINVMWATTKRDTASSIITSTIAAAALVAGIYAVSVGNAEISTVFLLFAYTADMTERLWQLSTSALRTYNRAIGDAQQAIITLNTESTVTDVTAPQLLKPRGGSLEFKDMDFSHAESADDALFEKFNLAIPAGSKVGLVGHSGSGKTTLTKLLLRFMDVDGGAILIDGQDIALTTQDDLRRNIAYVPQEPLLFHRSLAENIAYGKPGASQAEIEEAAKLAHAHEFIKTLPEGYDTLVGERGVKLSGGQRQRIAIARAMIKDAPILLLDEATSALDSESEALIQDALWKLMEGKTAIVIAHRLSTVQKMDQIVVLDNGKILEQGSHKQLLSKKTGAYTKLWSHQSGGFMED